MAWPVLSLVPSSPEVSSKPDLLDIWVDCQYLYSVDCIVSGYVLAIRHRSRLWYWEATRIPTLGDNACWAKAQARLCQSNEESALITLTKDGHLLYTELRRGMSQHVSRKWSIGPNFSFARFNMHIQCIRNIRSWAISTSLLCMMSLTALPTICLIVLPWQHEELSFESSLIIVIQDHPSLFL